MSFRLFVSNAEGLNLGPERYSTVHDAIAAATCRIARQRGTGWRVRVLNVATGRVTASYEVDASPETYAPFVGALYDVAAAPASASPRPMPSRPGSSRSTGAWAIWSAAWIGSTCGSTDSTRGSTAWPGARASS